MPRKTLENNSRYTKNLIFYHDSSTTLSFFIIFLTLHLHFWYSTYFVSFIMYRYFFIYPFYFHRSFCPFCLPPIRSFPFIFFRIHMFSQLRSITISFHLTLFLFFVVFSLANPRIVFDFFIVSLSS